MSDTKIYHLSEDQLAQAILDPKDLSPEHRLHLNQCYQCFKHMRLLERELISLGRAALNAAPIPQKRFQISSYKKTKENNRENRRLSYPILKPITILLCVMTLTMIGGRFLVKYQTPQRELAKEEVVLSEDMMNEIGVLINNPLPDIYSDFFNILEIDHDGDFMEFIVPPIESNSINHSIYGMKGSFSC